MTTILSAPRMVDKRCAITIVVRPADSLSNASWTTFSDWASSAEVASSSNRIGVSLSRARAMTTRWRWPPERAEPRGPTLVSKPSGRFSRKSDTCAASRTPLSCSSVTSVRPSRMFSRRVSSNSKASCVTTEKRPRKSFRAISGVGTSLISMDPVSGSTRRVSRLKIVDFPAPEAPTRAVVLPGSATNDRSCRTVLSP